MRVNRLFLSNNKVKALFHFVVVIVIAITILALHGRVTAPTASARTLDFISPVPTSGNSEIDRFILESSAKHGVDPKLVYYVIRQESNFKLSARSHKNAQGLMQMIPATADRFGVEDVYNPQQNIEGGVRYLRWLLKRFNGNVNLALAGYNAGEGAVEKSGNQVPDYKETQNYVKKITGAYGKTHHPVLTPNEAAERFGVAEVLAE
jgi:soluble lytic murein transglycosylase-like protein